MIRGGALTYKRKDKMCSSPIYLPIQSTSQYPLYHGSTQVNKQIINGCGMRVGVAK